MMRLRWLGIPFALFFVSGAFGQVDPGQPGWAVRVIDTAGIVDNYAKHNAVLGLGDVLQIDDSGPHDVINFNGSGFDDDDPWPVTLAEDFVVRGFADATIPAGHWGVGWGSDDGGQLHIPGVEFVTRFNTAGGFQPNDQLVFDGNRGYNTTWGSFSLDAPLETTIDVSMWERGGGDNFDVFVINLGEQYGIEAADLTDAATDTPNRANLWDLLGVGDRSGETNQPADWNIRTPASLPPVAIPVIPGQKINGTAMNVVKEEVGEVKPGLLHFWYGRNNPGSLEGVAAFYDINAGPIEEPDIAPFNPDNTWWTGNQAALVGGTTEAPKYPAEIIDQVRLDGTTFNGNDNSNYTTALSGELRVPRDGEYLFTDGVDDLTVLAIDANRDGEFDPDSEILINDNAWTSLNRSENNGGFTTNGGEYIPITFDVPEDGNCDDPANAADACWFRMEVIAAEGGGTDAGIIYWNENGNIQFPNAQGDGRAIADEDMSEIAIPEDHMRAPGGIVVTSANLVATLNGDFPYDFEINEDGTFDSLTVNRALEVATTELNLNGATIALRANGDISGLTGELKLLSADALNGEVTVDVEGLGGVAVDTSRVASEGILVFGDPGPGFLEADFNQDGIVNFTDFLTLSTQFNQTVDPPGTPPDINGDGVVNFPDFLVLSTQFNMSQGGAQAVPEPSSLALLGIAGLLGGLVRRRRR